MSALAEALVAAQRRALQAVEKQYAAGRIPSEDVIDRLNAVGLNDAVDQERLLNALDIIREYGAALPNEPTNGRTNGDANEKATDAQLTLIARLVTEKHAVAPDRPLTKLEAHEIIDTLKAGTYDAAKWTVPF